MAGTKKWWPRKALEKFAMAHLALPVGRIGMIIERVAEAVTDTRKELSVYMREHPEFREVGSRMLSVWEEGVKDICSE